MRESQLWGKIRIGYYSWLQLPEDKKSRLFKIIGTYSSFQDLVESVESLNNKVEKIKQLKDGNNGEN